MMLTRKAFTLAELVVVVMLLGIMVFITVPKMQYGTLRRQKADTVSRRIITDLRLAQRLAISNAATNVTGYSLKMTGSSPYRGYQIIDLSNNAVVESYSIDSDINCSGGSNFKFGPLGNLLTGSDSQLLVSAEGKIFTMNIVTATGTVKCSEN